MERKENTKAPAAATIGDIRRQGLEALYASCLLWNGGCGRSGRVLLDALDLVDTTVFLEIPRARRLTCSVCGTRSFAIMPDWRDYVAFGNGQARLT